MGGGSVLCRKRAHGYVEAGHGLLRCHVSSILFGDTMVPNIE